MTANTGRMPVDVSTMTLSAAAEKAIADGRLNRAQAAAAYSSGKATLTLGPPGTGKTTTLVERVGVLLDEGVPAKSIFCCTYMAAAAREICERVSARHPGRLVLPDGTSPAFGTFHSLGLRFLRRIAPLVGFPKFEKASNDERSSLAKKLGIDLGFARRARIAKSNPAIGGDVAGAVPDVGWHGPGFGGDQPLSFGGGGEGGALGQMLRGQVPAAVILGRVHDTPFLELASRWGDKLIFPDDAIRIASGDNGKCVPDEALLKRAKDYKRYKEALHSAGRIDEADMIALPVKFLRERADLRASFQSRFSAILCDEYQDINTALGALIDILAGGLASLWCVGDPDQTLFGFRGSDPSFILEFPDRWPEATVIALTENYRCRPPIIAAANRLIVNNKNRYETALTATRESEALPRDIGLVLSTPNLRYPQPKFARQTAVEVAAYPDDTSEARDVARKVAGLIGLGVSPDQIAILSRSSYRGYHTFQALRGAGVRLKVLSGQDKKDPEESQLVDALLRAVYIPAVGGRVSDREEVWRKIRVGEGGEDRGKRLLVEVEQLKKDGYSSPNQWAALVDAVEELIVAEGPRERSSGQDGEQGGGGISLRWQSRVQAACRAALDRGSYESWCAASAIVGRDAADTDGGGPGVLITTMGTIHGVKGLEYQHVFIIGLENDVCPDGGDIANEEERRLFYVALTRARDTATISWAKKRAGDRYPAKASPYIDEAFWGVPGIPFIDYGVEGGEGAAEVRQAAPSGRRAAAAPLVAPGGKDGGVAEAPGLDVDDLEATQAKRVWRQAPPQPPPATGGIGAGLAGWAANQKGSAVAPPAPAGGGAGAGVTAGTVGGAPIGGHQPTETVATVEARRPAEAAPAERHAVVAPQPAEAGGGRSDSGRSGGQGGGEGAEAASAPSAPAAAGGDTAGRGASLLPEVHFVLSAKGGEEDCQVWRVLVIDGDNKPVFDQFINPNGDSTAYLEAMNDGVDGSMLDEADDLNGVLSLLRRGLQGYASRNGLTPVLHVQRSVADALGVAGWPEVVVG